MCRLLTLEDNLDSPVTKMKYFLEPAANAQKRFDKEKEWFDNRIEDVYPYHHGSYYFIRVVNRICTCQPAPVWFYKKNLRRDQIDYLEKRIELLEQRSREKKKTNF